jgi:hypothetical protein
LIEGKCDVVQGHDHGKQHCWNGGQGMFDALDCCPVQDIAIVRLPRGAAKPGSFGVRSTPQLML